MQVCSLNVNFFFFLFHWQKKKKKEIMALCQVDLEKNLSS